MRSFNFRQPTTARLVRSVGFTGEVPKLNRFLCSAVTATPNVNILSACLRVPEHSPPTELFTYVEVYHA
jgi:hypothetical protein